MPISRELLLSRRPIQDNDLLEGLEAECPKRGTDIHEGACVAEADGG